MEKEYHPKCVSIDMKKGYPIAKPFSRPLNQYEASVEPEKGQSDPPNGFTLAFVAHIPLRSASRSSATANSGASPNKPPELNTVSGSLHDKNNI